MTLRRWYYIRCNGCGRLHGNGAATSKDARYDARRNGWKRVKGSASSGADYCPGCAEKNRAA